MGTYNGYYKINSTDLLDVLYPVGSIYISTNASFNPQTAWGGKWENVSAGYALWTATSDGAGTIPAGLPNICGSLYSQTNTAFIGDCSGAFYSTDNTGDHHYYTGSGYTTRNITIKASNYSGMYGRTSTVQPPAYKVYVWRRIP